MSSPSPSGSPSTSPSTASASASAAAALFRRVLTNRTAHDIITMTMESSTSSSPPVMIEIDSKCTPLEASMVLWNHHILGAPVWDDTTQTYLGFFDIRDTLSAAIASAHHRKHQNRATTKDNDNDIIANVSSIRKTTTKWLEDDYFPFTVSYLAARNPFVSCTPETSLHEVCALLSHPHCHRIPVLGPNGRCTFMISQSTLVRALVRLIDDDQDDDHDHAALDETLEEAHLLNETKVVVSALDTDSALHVFTLMDSNHLSGIAICDSETGKLVGTTTARDVLWALFDDQVDLWNTNMDILSYLAFVRQATPALQDRYPSAHVATTSTVKHVLKLLEKTGYHRVFVVQNSDENGNNNNIPVGVVSVSDILALIVKG